MASLSVSDTHAVCCRLELWDSWLPGTPWSRRDTMGHMAAIGPIRPCNTERWKVMKACTWLASSR